jgi:release factor glutamine methyltransferase
MSRQRVVRYRGLRIAVPVGVFPPHLFFSTKLMCATVADMELTGRAFLEVGCGSGAVSLVAARRGADVTAMDISPLACEAARVNASTNGVAIEVFESDLFANVDGRFEIVVITPPYFRHDPETQLDRAFHAGANFEYFHRLFGGLGEHLSDSSECLLTLAEACDAEIAEIAARHGFDLQIHRSKMAVLQWTYVFRVVRTPRATSR